MNRPSPAPHTRPICLFLHLAPRVLTAASYLALVPVALAWGLPSAAAPGASALLVAGPLLLDILTWPNRAAGTRHRPSPYVGYLG